MIEKLYLLGLLMLLLGACNSSGDPVSNLGEVRNTAEAQAAITATVPILEVDMDTREPPPVPSPLPTVTATMAAGTEPISFPADDERIRYIGRFDFQDSLEPAFDWSGSAIEFAFSGTSLTIVLEDGRNSYNVTVDDQRQVLETEMGVEHYLVADDLQPGEHLFRLSKRTEAYVGAAVFKGVQISGGDLQQPPAGAKRRLEFIGDSITTGYGNEGQSADCWFTPQTQNAEKSYAAFTAEGLDAEYTLIALSGLGVVRNLGQDTAVSSQTAIDYVERALGLDPFIIWPADRGIPDAVIINLGTNDYSSVPFPEEEGFIEAYMELLQAVRERYPQAFIFAVAGPLMLEPAPRVIEVAVERFRAARDDDGLKYVLIEDNLEPSAEDFGCDWHPNVNGHGKIASQLMPVIADQLGW